MIKGGTEFTLRFVQFHPPYTLHPTLLSPMEALLYKEMGSKGTRPI